jgi:hypothetical protein
VQIEKPKPITLRFGSKEPISQQVPALRCVISACNMTPAPDLPPTSMPIARIRREHFIKGDRRPKLGLTHF